MSDIFRSTEQTWYIIFYKTILGINNHIPTNIEIMYLQLYLNVTECRCRVLFKLIKKITLFKHVECSMFYLN